MCIYYVYITDVNTYVYSQYLQSIIPRALWHVPTVYKTYNKGFVMESGKARMEVQLKFE